MNFKEYMLSKSHSYNFYKNKYEMSKDEIKALKNEINDIKLNKQQSVKNEFLNSYGEAISFCNQNYMKYYLSDDFEDKFKELTKNLDKTSKDRLKLIFLRVLFVNMITQDSLYFKDELKEQKVFKDFENFHISDNKVESYKFFGEYNIHSFINIHLTQNEIEYIKDKEIIDAGAFTGDTSLPLSKITKKNVYAFEPFNDSFELLKMNIEKNNIKNIIPINKSLGNINGDRILYLSKNNFQGITSDSSIRSYDTELHVQEITIDKFVKDNDLNVGYITVDVEGAEMNLLEGAINTIKSQKPILLISIYHKIDDFFNIIPWVANLNLNYRFEIFKEQPWPFLADTVVKCSIEK